MYNSSCWRGRHRSLTQVVESVQIRGVFQVVPLEEVEVEQETLNRMKPKNVQTGHDER